MSHSIKHQNFCSEPMGNKPVFALPGVGEVTTGRLNAMGYYKARDVYELLRKFSFDEDTFCSWMSSNFRGCRAYDCYSALMKWHRQFGETNTVRVPERKQRDWQPTVTRSSPPRSYNSNNIERIFGFNQVPRSGLNPRDSEHLFQNPGTPERTFEQVFRNRPITPVTSEQYCRAPIFGSNADRTPIIPDQSVQSPRISDVLIQNRRDPEQSVQNLRTSGQPVPTQRTSESSVQNLRTSEESVQTPSTSERSVQNRRTSEQSAETPRTVEQLVENRRACEQSVQSPSTTERSLQNRRTSEQPVQNPRTSEQPTQNRTTSEQSVQAPRTSEQSVQNTRTSEQHYLINTVETDPLTVFFLAMEATVKKLKPVLQNAVVGVAPRPDPIKAFFQQMQATIKSFEPETVLEIKSEIFRIVTNYERRDLVMRTEPVASTSTAST